MSKESKKRKKALEDSKVHYTTMESIQYIIKNGSRGDEWQEAGLYHAIVEVVNGSCYLTHDRLDQLLEKAERN